MMTGYEVHLLPDGRRWIAEDHVITDQGLAALVAGRAEQPSERVWTWSPADATD
ncbi:hypothetical protein [Kitasatospora cheerisanensis]|nr:hypothetical protein [Kitasatospora cheerisanensis]